MKNISKFSVTLLTSIALAPIVVSSLTSSQVKADDNVSTSENSNLNADQSDDDSIYYLSNEDILNQLHQTNSQAYSQIPQNLIDDMNMQDMLRQGGTYVKKHKNGFTLYLNSAIVSTGKYVGTGAIYGSVASLIYSTAGAGTGVAEGIQFTLGSALQSVPSNKGIYINVNYNGPTFKFGEQ